MKAAIGAILVAMVVGIGGWYYFTQIHATDIAELNSNPRDHVGKELTISGTVQERFSLFIAKYFILKDASGEIIVVTDKPLPAVGAKTRVRGYLKESFSIGEQQSLVFVENPTR